MTFDDAPFANMGERCIAGGEASPPTLEAFPPQSNEDTMR